MSSAVTSILVVIDQRYQSKISQKTEESIESFLERIDRGVSPYKNLSPATKDGKQEAFFFCF